MKRNKKLIPAVLCFLLSAALFVVPGVRFSAYFFSGLGVLWCIWLLLTHFERKCHVISVCKRIFLVGIFGVTILICSLEWAILSCGEDFEPDISVDAIIVLGAGVNGETPSAALRSRIDAAAEYIYGYCAEGVPVVLSGGQGNGENISEAEAMYRALMDHRLRVPEKNVNFLLEDGSTSTAENFRYSKEILNRHGVETETAVIAVVTNDFHAFRSHLIARGEGISTVSVPAELPWWWLQGNYYLREAFALVKTLLFD